MRPDRFGQSRLGEFVESQGREREHAYDGPGTNTPGIIIRLILSGFYIGSGGSTAASNLELYRAASYRENIPFILGDWHREAEFELLRPVFRLDDLYPNSANPVFSAINKLDPATLSAVKGTWVEPGAPLNFPAAPGFTSSAPDEIVWGVNGNITTTLSRKMDLWAWVRLMNKFLSAVGDFPATGRNGWVLVPVKGFSVPDSPDEEEVVSLVRGEAVLPTGTYEIFRSGDWELHPFDGAGQQPIRSEIDYASLAMLSGTGDFWPFEGRNFRGLPGATFTIELQKVLMPLSPMPATVKIWDIESRGLSYSERNCQAASPGEVLMPNVDEMAHTGTHAFPVQLGVRRYQIPGSQKPGPASGIGAITPSCAPFWV